MASYCFYLMKSELLATHAGALQPPQSRCPHQTPCTREAQRRLCRCALFARLPSPSLLATRKPACLAASSILNHNSSWGAPFVPSTIHHPLCHTLGGTRRTPWRPPFCPRGAQHAFLLFRFHCVLKLYYFAPRSFFPRHSAPCWQKPFFYSC